METSHCILMPRQQYADHGRCRQWLGCTPLSFLKASTTETQSRSHLSTWRSFRRHTVLEHYLFNAKDGDMLLALGLGSLFNHSRRPNLDYRVDGREQARSKDTSMVQNARTCEIGWSLRHGWGVNIVRSILYSCQDA